MKFQTVNGLTIDDVGGDGDHERVRDTRVAEEAAVGDVVKVRSGGGSDKTRRMFALTSCPVSASNSLSA